jgi:hypothetical protein
MVVVDLKNKSVVPVVPGYEVRLFLDPALALNSEMNVRSLVRDMFGMSRNKNKMTVQYIDTEELELDMEGWIARVEKREDNLDKEFELTYKKRYPVANGDIESAVSKAALEGFDKNAGYDAEIEWNHTKQTLTFSKEVKVTKKGYDGLEPLTKKHSINKLIDNVPKELKNWGKKDWGIKKLEVAKKLGPVDAERWIGEWKNQKVYIEVWKIINNNGSAFDYTVELSFKTDSFVNASNLKNELEGLLIDKGLFLPIDELKTQMILRQYN